MSSRYTVKARRPVAARGARDGRGWTHPGHRASLHTALTLAAPLGFLDMALRYRGQRASVVRLHPGMREVPQTVRLALAALRPAR